MGAFRDGDLPGICVKTGEPAEFSTPVVATRTPDWPCLLLFFGILPFLIASAFSTERAEGMVPFSGSALRRLRQVRMTRWGTLLAALVLLVLLLLRGEPAVLVVLFFAALAGVPVLYALDYAWSVGARLDLEAGAVLLRGVHPDFKQAVEAGSFGIERT